MYLDPTQLRVLGALIEKEITTPDSYPLSLNALVNACNQRSNRDPVLDLDEEQVRQALHALEEQGLTAPYRDARVTKYEHCIRTVLNLRRDETALLCLLLLRGPQTPGELRARSDRMYSFDDLASVTSTLERLANRPSPPEAQTEPTGANATTGPLVTVLPRRPGAREARYAHLLGGLPVEAAASPPVSASQLVPAASDAPASLIAEVLNLSARVDQLADTIELLQLRIGELERRG